MWARRAARPDPQKPLLRGTYAGRAPQAVAAKGDRTLRDNRSFSGLLSTAHLFYFLAQLPPAGCRHEREVPRAMRSSSFQFLVANL